MPVQSKPELIRSSTGKWYVTWYDDRGKRCRSYKGLNKKFKSSVDRELAAQRLISEIEEAQQGQTVSREDKLELKMNLMLDEMTFMRTRMTRLEEALGVGKAMKRVDFRKAMETFTKLRASESDRADTVNQYNSMCRLFLVWLEGEGLHTSLHEFGVSQARQYMDYLVLKKNYANDSYNLHLSFLRSAFTSFVKKKYIRENPFGDFKRKRKNKGKKNDLITKAERKLITAYYREHYPWAYKALLLQFYCLVRPRELVRMKFKDFDFKHDVVRITEDQAKTHKFRAPTIPKVILHEFRNEEFMAHEPNWHVFSTNLLPGAKKAGKNSGNILHDKVLTALGINRKGLSWYSWKHTGSTLMDSLLDPSQLKGQGGWSSYEVMEHYLHRPDVIEAVRELPDLLL
ncbi:MAG: phage integrase SAM-like domain-containing protein [Bacteroidota bacterium]